MLFRSEKLKHYLVRRTGGRNMMKQQTLSIFNYSWLVILVIPILKDRLEPKKEFFIVKFHYSVKALKQDIAHWFMN